MSAIAEHSPFELTWPTSSSLHCKHAKTIFSVWQGAINLQTCYPTLTKDIKKATTAALCSNPSAIPIHLNQLIQGCVFALLLNLLKLTLTTLTVILQSTGTSSISGSSVLMVSWRRSAASKLAIQAVLRCCLLPKYCLSTASRNILSKCISFECGTRVMCSSKSQTHMLNFGQISPLVSAVWPSSPTVRAWRQSSSRQNRIEVFLRQQRIARLFGNVHSC